MTNTKRDIDYAGVSIPEDTDPTEYHYTHRRAALLDDVLEHGTPAAINQTEAGERYGVDQSQISKDLDALAEYMDEHLGEQAALESEAVYSKAIEGLLEEARDGNWRAYKAAAEVIDKRNEWLGEVGAQHREPTRSEVDLDADIRSRATEGGYYVVEQRDADGDDVEGVPIDVDDVDEAEDLGFTATPETE